MPKAKVNQITKIYEIIRQYPNEFSLLKNELNCKLCHCPVNCEKKFFVNSHRESKKHKDLMIKPNQCKLVNFEKPTEDSWAYQVTKAFLEADIPLQKIHSESLNKLFSSMNRPLPSVSKCRSMVEFICKNVLQEINRKLRNKKIFMIIDESDINNQKYVNTLIGDISNPSLCYLVDCRPLNNSPNANIIAQIADDNLRNMNTSRSDFLLLISDAAPYMLKAGETIKVLYSNLFHITCLAHLLHNCALRVKTYYKDVDNLISSIKGLTVKNKARRQLFSDIGAPPDPIVTRWGSWLSASQYYSENLPAVRTIVSSIEGEGIIVKKAKEALQSNNISQQLREIFSYYLQIKDLIMYSERSDSTIDDLYFKIKSLSFGNDPCQIKDYVEKRLQKNEIARLLNMELDSITPADYAFLMKCQPTSVNVERSFSLLSKLLAKDRNFKPNNVLFYAIPMFNKL